LPVVAQIQSLSLLQALTSIGDGCRPFAGHLHLPIRLGLHCA
jgi:hypothetical protein